MSLPESSDAFTITRSFLGFLHMSKHQDSTYSTYFHMSLFEHSVPLNPLVYHHLPVNIHESHENSHLGYLPFSDTPIYTYIHKYICIYMYIYVYICIYIICIFVWIHDYSTITPLGSYGSSTPIPLDYSYELMPTIMGIILTNV